MRPNEICAPVGAAFGEYVLSLSSCPAALIPQPTLSASSVLFLLQPLFDAAKRQRVYLVEQCVVPCNDAALPTHSNSGEVVSERHRWRVVRVGVSTGRTVGYSRQCTLPVIVERGIGITRRTTGRSRECRGEIGVGDVYGRQLWVLRGNANRSRV